MNKKKYKKIEKHYNKLVDNKTIKTLNDALIYKKAIEKAFSLFDVGKQLLCIDDKWFSYDITKGKKYELIKKDKNHFYIINDSGKEFGYKKNRFVKL